MANFRLYCKECEGFFYKLGGTRSELENDKTIKCKYCKCSNVVLAPTGPNRQVNEKLDNGVMPKVVERLVDAEALNKERSMNADPLAGGAARQIDYGKQDKTSSS